MIMILMMMSFQAPGYYEPPTTVRSQSQRPPATSKYHTDVGAIIKVVAGDGGTQRFPKSKSVSHYNYLVST